MHGNVNRLRFNDDYRHNVQLIPHELTLLLMGEFPFMLSCFASALTRFGCVEGKRNWNKTMQFPIQQKNIGYCELCV